MGCCIKAQQSANRKVYFTRQLNTPQINNQVQTTKYTWYSFLPKAILLQFLRPANFVYLISAILQSIPMISSLSPLTAIAPFVFVMGMSLGREGYEHYKRYKKDKEINERKCRILKNNEFVEVLWEEINLGDIIKVKNDQIIPADFLLLSSTEENQLCYVQTATLDGETNLKTKFACSQITNLYPIQFNQLRGTITVDHPNSDLHRFSGTVQMQGTEQKKYVDFSNILLRETVLKNTDQAVGVVLYPGYDSKIVKNQGQSETKMSQVEKKVNWIQGFSLLILIILSTACSIGFYIKHRERDSLWYLTSQVKEFSTEVVLIFFTSFLLLTFLIPISLNVSIQVIKGFLGIFLTFDDAMYHEPTDSRCIVNNVSILEDLGDIGYVLTDKTGTLTANEMIFKLLGIANKTYSTEYIIRNVHKLKKDPQFHHFWIGLIICHDVVCDPESKQYHGSSPDEVCFLNFAKTIGYQFVKRTKNSLELNVHKQKIVYELLHILPFDMRKRMSVVVRNLETQKIHIFTKGADSCVFQKAQPYSLKQKLVESINKFAKHGYRTLLFSQREITQQEYEELNNISDNLKVLRAKKKLRLELLQKKQVELVEKFESQLQILGATGVEDRLQDDVPVTISRLQQAGIVVMMITGDKLETAENIGYLAHFIKESSQVFHIRAEFTPNDLYKKMEEIKNFKLENYGIPVSIVVEGQAIQILLDSGYSLQYGQILHQSSSVIFCRSSPKEKSNIVKFVKQKLRGIVLAIGDGGNDVGMIQMANIGVGIRGKEGSSASVVSDFSIGEFKFLERLVLHHGRWFYYRLSYFFVYYGWKNLMMTLLLFFFMAQSGFSGFPGLSQPFIAAFNSVIGLFLLLYYTIFEQDINDDIYKPVYKHLPELYKEVKSQKLFSYSRYLIWSLSGIIIAIFIFCVTRYSLGSFCIIGTNGTIGNLTYQSAAFSIVLSLIVIIILISDMKMFTWFSTFLAIGVITILGTILFFLLQNFIPRFRNYYFLNNTTKRFWLTVILLVGTIYSCKLFFDTLKQEYGKTNVEKLLTQKNQSEETTNKNMLSVIHVF